MKIEKQMFPYQQSNLTDQDQYIIPQQGLPFSSEQSLNQSFEALSLSEKAPFEAEQDVLDFFCRVVDSLKLQFPDQNPCDLSENDEMDWLKTRTKKRDFDVTKKITKKAKTQTQVRKKAFQSQPEQENSQNKNRNIPGLLFGAMLKLCSETPGFFESQINFTEGRREEFLAQSKNFQRNRKTYNAVALFAVSIFDEELVTLALLTKFLKSEHHFSEWIEQSKMAQEQKEILREEHSRDLYLRKFEVVFQEVKNCLEKCRCKGLAEPTVEWNENYKNALSNKIKKQNKIFNY